MPISQQSRRNDEEYQPFLGQEPDERNFEVYKHKNRRKRYHFVIDLINMSYYKPYYIVVRKCSVLEDFLYENIV